MSECAECASNMGCLEHDFKRLLVERNAIFAENNRLSSLLLKTCDERDSVIGENAPLRSLVGELVAFLSNIRPFFGNDPEATLHKELDVLIARAQKVLQGDHLGGKND